MNYRKFLFHTIKCSFFSSSLQTIHRIQKKPTAAMAPTIATNDTRSNNIFIYEKKSVLLPLCIVSHGLKYAACRQTDERSWMNLSLDLYRCRTYTHKAFWIQSSNKIHVIRSVCKWMHAFSHFIQSVSRAHRV